VSIFTEALIDNDPEALEESVNEQIEAAFEGWTPAEGALETWLTKAYARIAELVRDQVAVITKGAFKKFGETIVGVPPILAAPATATSTWTMVDAAGYSIPAETLVAIAVSGNEKLGFQTVAEVMVEAGKTATEAGEVVLQAVEAGEDANNLTEDPVLIDSLSYVSEIALVEETKGGVDEEDEDTYLNRLTEALQLLSLSLIVQRDFEIDARAISGIARAVCLPAWDGKEEDAAPLQVTVIGIDAEGKALSAGKKEELQERQQAKVPDEVIVHTADPAYTSIDVEAEVEVLPGYDGPTVVEAVEARLAGYLSPEAWGLPATGDASNSSAWENKLKVYFLEVVSEVDRVAGVSRVIALKIAETGKALGTADVSLKGIVPLAEAGELKVTAA